MKIVCEKENILKAINSVTKAVASKTTMPILEGILIQTNDMLSMKTGTRLSMPLLEKQKILKKKGHVRKKQQFLKNWQKPASLF